MQLLVKYLKYPVFENEVPNDGLYCIIDQLWEEEKFKTLKFLINNKNIPTIKRLKKYYAFSEIAYEQKFNHFSAFVFDKIFCHNFINNNSVDILFNRLLTNNHELFNILCEIWYNKSEFKFNTGHIDYFLNLAIKYRLNQRVFSNIVGLYDDFRNEKLYICCCFGDASSSTAKTYNNKTLICRKDIIFYLAYQLNIVPDLLILYLVDDVHYKNLFNYDLEFLDKMLLNWQENQNNYKWIVEAERKKTKIPEKVPLMINQDNLCKLIIEQQDMYGFWLIFMKLNLTYTETDPLFQEMKKLIFQKELICGAIELSDNLLKRKYQPGISDSDYVKKKSTIRGNKFIKNIKDVGELLNINFEKKC